MPIKILMPALSPTMTEGILSKWLKKEGDTIRAGEVIAEIETDKATMEVEAVDEGILAKIIVPAGTNEVAVNSLIAVLLDDGENQEDLDLFISSALSSSTSQSPQVAKQLAEIKQVSVQENNVNDSIKVLSDTTFNKGDRIFVSPLAKRIASLEGISLAGIVGSGPHGRIIKADLEQVSKHKGRVIRNPQEFRLIPNNNMRKVIAKRLVESKQTVPHFYLNIDCIMDSLLEERKQINEQFENDNTKKLSVNDFVIIAVAKALKEVPEANASWSNDVIMLYNNIDISVAVAINGGLITPIIKNADQKEIFNISSEMKELAKRARKNRLVPEEYQGGGFSISNLGMYGIKSFNAIVNPPQGCILAIGQSSKRAVVVNDKIKVKTVMEVNLSCDHRVVDGAVGAQFLASFKKYIEAPILLFI